MSDGRCGPYGTDCAEAYTGLMGIPGMSLLTFITVVVLTSFIWAPVLVIVGGFIRDVIKAMSNDTAA